MPENKHTPGPWRMACDSYGKVQHSRKYDCVFTTFKGEKEDRIYVVAARIESSKDALLIAAAPDMLAALNHAENELIRLKASIAQLAPIRAAISKAEGKQL